VLLSALLVLAGACHPAPDTDGPDDTGTPPVGRAVATILEPIPTVVEVAWTAPHPGEGWVEFGLDGALDRRTPAVPGAGTRHRQILLGLKAGRTYSWRAVSADGTWASEVGTVDLPAPPPGMVLPVLDLDLRPLAGQGGYVLTSLQAPDGAWVVIYDQDGDLVWAFPADAGTVVLTVLPGRLRPGILFGQECQNVPEMAAAVRIDVEGSQRIYTPTPGGHHALDELPDGEVARVVLDERLTDVDGTEVLVVGDKIQVHQEGGTPDASWTAWSFWDDSGLEPDPDELEHWMGGTVWTHCNSLVVRPEGWYAMARDIDTLVKLDPETHQVDWLMGGPGNQFAAPAGTLWNHGHVSDIWDGGMVMIDNGVERDPRESRVVEYAWDAEHRTVEKVWDYGDPGVRYMEASGDVRRLPDGGYLVSWGSYGQIQEITPEGEVTWQLSLPIGAAYGRLRWIEDLYELL
jgi:hypothetical protein